MLRPTLLFLFVLAANSWAADLKLYLKEGGFHVVREYEIKTDRVRFFSVERGEWEEMPLELVDLKKTQGEQKRRETSEAETKKADAAERDAERRNAAKSMRFRTMQACTGSTARTSLR